MHAIRRTDALRFEQAVQLFFYFADGVRIQQLAQVSVPEQIAQLLLVDGKGLGSSLGQRRIAVIDVIGYVAKQQRGGEGGGSTGIGNMHAYISLLDGAQSLQ